MRFLIVTAALGLALTAAACSKPTQDKTAQDLKAVGSDVKDAARQVADTPAAKSLGSDIKQGAGEAAEKTKEAAAKAGEKLKAGAQTAADKGDQAVHDATKR